MANRRAPLLACSALLLLLPMCAGFSAPSAGLAQDLSRRRLQIRTAPRTATPPCGLRMQAQAEPPKGSGYARSATQRRASASLAGQRAARRCKVFAIWDGPVWAVGRCALECTRALLSQEEGERRGNTHARACVVRMHAHIISFMVHHIIHHIPCACLRGAHARTRTCMHAREDEIRKGETNMMHDMICHV